MHPSKQSFVIAEKGDKPKIIARKWPDLTIFKTLEEGAVKTFSCLAFNARGDRFASVAGYPDYTLTVWDWEQGIILQKSKAFSQVRFKLL